jgi:hypothetical protein
VHVRCNRVRCAAARVSVPDSQGRPHYCGVSFLLSSPTAILSAGAAARAHETRRRPQPAHEAAADSSDRGHGRPRELRTLGDGIRGPFPPGLCLRLRLPLGAYKRSRFVVRSCHHTSAAFQSNLSLHPPLRQ